MRQKEVYIIIKREKKDNRMFKIVHLQFTNPFLAFLCNLKVGHHYGLFVLLLRIFSRDEILDCMTRFFHCCPVFHSI